MTKDAGTELIQRGLAMRGYDIGPAGADGIFGPRTAAAGQAWLSAGGKYRPVAPAPVSEAPVGGAVPWVTELLSVFGLHETRDNVALRKWLLSDGATLGNPAQLPWCGDAMETAIKRALPKEPFEGDMKANPYWARNWLGFGVTCQPAYGAVAVFSREGGGGHVGVVVAQDANRWHVLGGNQGNAINVVGIDKRRLLGFRWPVTFPNRNQAVPHRPAGDIATSRNEV